MSDLVLRLLYFCEGFPASGQPTSPHREEDLGVDSAIPGSEHSAFPNHNTPTSGLHIWSEAGFIFIYDDDALCVF